jgi:hypothetical protein
MRDSYDLFNGGLEQLEQDLIKWEQDLLMANSLYALDLINVTKEGIINRANLADEQDTVDDVKSMNVIERIPESNEKPTYIVYNMSDKMAYAEFGYGMVGKGTYRHNEFIQGFDESTYGTGRTIKRDGRWYYKDRAGETHMTFGSNAKHIMFYSAQETIQRIPSEFTKYKGKLGLK